ncbi:hypothetical protein ACFLZQ_05610 [Thermodesulfobacteriota bacterium]
MKGIVLWDIFCIKEFLDGKDEGDNILPLVDKKPFKVWGVATTVLLFFKLRCSRYQEILLSSRESSFIPAGHDNAIKSFLLSCQVLTISPQFFIFSLSAVN